MTCHGNHRHSFGVPRKMGNSSSNIVEGQKCMQQQNEVHKYGYQLKLDSYQHQLAEERHQRQLEEEEHQRQLEEERRKRFQESENHKIQLETERRWNLEKLIKEKRENEKLEKQMEDIERKLKEETIHLSTTTDRKKTYVSAEVNLCRQQDVKCLQQPLVGRPRQEKKEPLQREEVSHHPLVQQLLDECVSRTYQQQCAEECSQLQQEVGLHRQHKEKNLHHLLESKHQKEEQHPFWHAEALLHKQQGGRNIYPSLEDYRQVKQETKGTHQQRQLEEKNLNKLTAERHQLKQKEHLHQQHEERKLYPSLAEYYQQQEQEAKPPHQQQQQEEKSFHQPIISRNHHKQKAKKQLLVERPNHQQIPVDFGGKRKPGNFKRRTRKTHKKQDKQETLNESQVLMTDHLFGLIPVKREEICEAVLRDSLASKWNSMPPKKSFIKVEVQDDDSEFRVVNDCFKSTVMNGFNIVQVERIQNPYLLGSYILKRLELQSRFGTVSEVFLFRGTKLKNVNNICEDNFNWRLQGANKDDPFGMGVSFSSSFHATKFSDEDHDIKVMFLVRVLVSKVAEGNTKKIFSPQLTGNYHGLRNQNNIDTTQSKDGRIIAKYADNAFYPQYLIYYKKELSA